MEKTQEKSGDPTIAMPGARLGGLKIYRVIAIAGPILSCHYKISVQNKMAHQKGNISLLI